MVYPSVAEGTLKLFVIRMYNMIKDIVILEFNLVHIAIKSSSSCCIDNLAFYSINCFNTWIELHNRHSLNKIWILNSYKCHFMQYKTKINCSFKTEVFNTFSIIQGQATGMKQILKSK